jgi:hypothetical protein
MVKVTGTTATSKFTDNSTGASNRLRNLHHHLPSSSCILPSYVYVGMVCNSGQYVAINPDFIQVKFNNPLAVREPNISPLQFLTKRNPSSQSAKPFPAERPLS